MEIQSSSNQNSYSLEGLSQAFSTVSQKTTDFAKFLESNPFSQSPAKNTGSFFDQGYELFQDLRELGSFISNAATQQRALGQGGFSGAMDLGQKVLNSYLTISDIPTPTLGELANVLQGGSVGELAQNYLLRNFGKDALEFGLTRLGLDAAAFGRNELIEAATGYLSGQSGLEIGFNALTSGKLGESVLGAGGVEALGNAGAIAGTTFNVVGAAYSFYDIFNRWGKSDPVSGLIQGATAGAAMGSAFPVVGTVIGGVVGGAIGFVGGLIKTGKHKDQVARDQVRKAMENAGIIGKDAKLTLADGSQFDIGKDGGAKLQNVDGTSRRQYEVDFKNPLAAETVAMAQGMAAVLTGGDKKLGSDFTGYFVNAALSNATTLDEAKANLQAIFKQFGVSPDAVTQGIQGLRARGKVTAEAAAVYESGFRRIL